MRRLLKYLSVFALAVVAGSYVAFGPMGLDVLFPDDERETATIYSGLAPPAPLTSNDEAQDYMVAERVASLDGWSAFLAAHPNGAHAQSATAKVEQLLLEQRDSATAASNRASRDAAVPIGADNPASSASGDAVPAPGAAAVSARDAKVASQDSLAATPPAEGDVAAGTQLAALPPDLTCQRDEERLERLRSHPSSDGLVSFANQLGCMKLLPQIVSLIKSLAPTAAGAGVAADSPSDPQASNEAHQGPLVARADVAAPVSDESCERDEERLARLRANPSSDEARRIASELRCEALRPELQRLTEGLGSPATAPAMPVSSSVTSTSLLSQGCAGERAALDRLRKEPTAEAAGVFWRDLKCEVLRPQVHLLLESLNVASESVGSSAAREAGAHDSSSDASGPNSADPVTCRREMAELNRIRATPDLSDAKRFANAMTCAALKPQATRLLESLKE